MAKPNVSDDQRTMKNIDVFIRILNRLGLKKVQQPWQ